MNAHAVVSRNGLKDRDVSTLAATDEKALERAIDTLGTTLASGSLDPDEEAEVRCLLSEAFAQIGREGEAYDTVAKYRCQPLTENLTATRLAQVSLWLAHASLSQGNSVAAIESLERLVPHGAMNPDPRTRGLACLFLARAHRYLGQFDEARVHIKQAIDLFGRLNNERDLVKAYIGAGSIEIDSGDGVAALGQFQVAEKLLGSTKDFIYLGLLRANAAAVCVVRGEYRAAKLGLEGAVEKLRCGGDLKRLAVQLGNLCWILTIVGEWKRAEAVGEEALLISRRTGGNPWTDGACLDNLGRLRTVQGRWKEASEHLNESLRIFDRIGDPLLTRYTLLSMVELSILTGEIEKAKAAADRLVTLTERIRHPHLIAQALIARAEVAFVQGDHQLCLILLRKAEGITVKDGYVPLLAAAKQLEGRVRAAQHNFDEAYQFFSHSLSAFESMGDEYQIGRTSLEIGKALMAAKRLDEAVCAVGRAIEIFIELGAEPARAEAYQVNEELRAKLEEQAESIGEEEGLRVVRAERRVRDRYRGFDRFWTERLMNASCSDHFLLRELVSVTADLTGAQEVVLFNVAENLTVTPVVCHGCAQEEARRLARMIAQTMAASQGTDATARSTGAHIPVPSVRIQSSALEDSNFAFFLLSPRCQKDQLVLGISQPGSVHPLDSEGSPLQAQYSFHGPHPFALDWESPEYYIRTLLRLAEQGLESFELHQRLSRAWHPDQVTMYCLQRLPDFVIAGPIMRELLKRIRAISDSNAAVLITGESGTGKDLIARAIHLESLRRHHPFVAFNCSAVTQDIFESELFGHKRGSFTGAVSDHAGLIRTADGGTFFLDEIGDLRLDLQPKLLRYLQEGEVLPVGETQPVKVDVRVIAATNHDLEESVRRQGFREDLFHRLNFIRLDIPPLRERREEIPALISHYFERYKQEEKKGEVYLAQESVELMKIYHWPGNIRELQAEIRRLVLYAEEGRVVGPDQLSPQISGRLHPEAGIGRRMGTTNPEPMLREELPLDEAIGRLERRMIAQALDQTQGNLTHAAKVLRLSRKGLRMKLHRLRMTA